MHALLFEVLPNPGHEVRYFEHVNRLKPALEKHDGLLWLDRYRSISNPTKLLSHQLWRDDAAIAGWRQDTLHKSVQRAGREIHFEDYRIRVAELVVRIDGDEAAQFDVNFGADDASVLVVSGDDEFRNRMIDPFASINRDGAYIDVIENNGVFELTCRLKEFSLLPGFKDGFVALTKRDYSLRRREDAPVDGA